ncbi:glycosyltransferase family 2 protein [Sellimonas sp.]|uniref:glycosyltransferase family 2 protein n=1 Tax=Sellimonas sp. TaxID=2021466 RepID=UPI0025810310|nr:glycosyltransferase family 2 protein [Sellimonas sp.]
MENFLIIIPAYNEARNIESVLKGMEPFKKHTIIVNDGSTDETWDIIRKCGFKGLNNGKNYGVAYSIIRGLCYAAEYCIKKVIIMDADGQHNPSYIPQFLKRLEEYDFVFGCRFHKEESIPTNKWASNLFAAALYAELTGRYFTDLSCGFKGLHVDEGLITAVKNSQGFGIIYDIVSYALGKRADIGIVPVEAIYFYDELLYTPAKEIFGLLGAVDHFRQMCSGKASDRLEILIQDIERAVSRREKFHAYIASTNFWAFPICEDGYLFQIDPKDIWRWLEKSS